MPTPVTIGPATLRIFGHLHVDDEAVEPAKIIQNGNTAKVYVWDDEARRYNQFDTITDTKFTDRSDHLELTGVSKTSRNELGLTVDESQIRIEIRTKGCKSCG